MSAKIILALALVAALVAFASPFYLGEDEEQDVGAVAENELEAATLPFLLQKRRRPGQRLSRCIDFETGKICPCDRSKARGIALNNCRGRF